MVNTAEHLDDIPHRLSRLPGYVLRKYPALDESGRPAWPERWPIERVEERRETLGTIGFARAMMCEPIDESTLIFPPDSVKLANMRGLEPAFSAVGGRVVIGLDPAFTAHERSDESGIAAVSLDAGGFRHLIDVRGVRLDHNALADHVAVLSRMHRLAPVYCEANSGGTVLAELIRQRGIPCTTLQTTRQAKESRIEVLAAELGHKWVFDQPLGHPSAELKKLNAELQTFSFDRHCGDRLAALLMCVEGIRAFESRPKGRIYAGNLVSGGFRRIF